MRFSALRFIAILLASAHIVAVAQTYAATKGTLIIGVLTVESSYAQNSERPSRGVPDTVQFWIGPGGAWRIRTYAIDHDIHPHSLGDLGTMKNRPTEFAYDHIKKHYSDVLATTVVLELPDTGNTNAVRDVLARNKLKGSLVVAPNGFAFWNPDNGHYKTLSAPK
ncbi:MAG: hypothetical protein KBF63_07040 [Rhodoferax sp.]|nr:hypothetical protein [Rhodoferax sp.]